MPHDPLAPYQIDQPLTAEESLFFEALRTGDDLRGHLVAIEDTGARIEAADGGKRFLVLQERDSDATESLLGQRLLPLSEELYQQGRVELSFGAAGIALRLGLAVLGSENPNTLKSSHNLAVCQYSLGRQGEALPLYETVLEAQERVLGSEHPDTFMSRYNLAVCMTSLGRLNEALPFYEITLEALERVLEPENPDAIVIRNTLANWLYSCGRFENALSLYEDILAVQERMLYSENPDMLTVRHNVAACLSSLGRLEEALPHFERVLQERKRVMGAEHPDTLQSQNDLDMCLKSLGRSSEAQLCGIGYPLTKEVKQQLSRGILVFEQAQELLTRELGPEHLDTLTIVSSLASCLDALGRSSDALSLHERVLEGRARELGTQHPDTLTSVYDLAECLLSLNRYDDALSHYEHVLAERTRVLGSEHPDTLTSMHHLAKCLHFLSRYDEALRYNEHVFVGRSLALGAEHPDTLSSLNNMAMSLNDIGRFSDALHHYEQVVAARTVVLGANHPDTLISRLNQASCLQDLGRLDEALSYFNFALEAFEQVLGVEHQYTLICMSNLAECLRSLGQFDEALPHHERAAAIRARVSGEEHPDTLLSVHNLAECLKSLDRFHEALPHYKRALAGFTLILGPEHQYTLTSTSSLASCLDSLGRSSEALSHHESVLVERTRLLGADHPDTIIGRNNLAFCLEFLGQLNGALEQWRLQVKALQGRPQPGGLWLEALWVCANVLAKHASAGRLTDWPTMFDELSAALHSVIDLESPEQLEVARTGVANFYTTYLGLCIDQGRHDLIPQVLAARQGRKLAALVLEELETDGDKLDPESLRGRFNVIRLELRRLALGLRVVDGGLGQIGEPGQRTPDAKSAIARQRNQMAVYKAKLKEYRDLRTELEQSDPDFAVTAATLKPTMPELQACLGEYEGLVLLFEYSVLNSTPVRLALVVTSTTSVLLPLPEGQLQQGLTLTQAWDLRSNSRSGMRRAVMTEDIHELPETAPISYGGLASKLAKAVHSGLWAPLAPHLENLSNLHLVTHGNWHLLPIELGAIERLSLTSYPGFIYYYYLRHQSKMSDSPVPPGHTESVTFFKPMPSKSLGMAVHAAENDSMLETIPFVNAEAKLVEALWPGTVYVNPNLDAERPVLAILQLAAHGQADEQDPARANVLLRDQTIDFQRILSVRQHPEVVVLSACTVGRTTDDQDGEPLGLVGGFLLKGSRYVIAALQPVPDFYMPLLITLFYQSWLNIGTPNAAITEAKRRFRMGDWYEDTEHLIRTHYKPVIEQMIEAVISQKKTSSWDDSLLRLTHAWPFPKRYRDLHPVEHQHRLDALRETIANTKNRAKLAEEILDTFVTERGQLPDMVVDALCTWVRGFGDVSSKT